MFNLNFTMIEMSEATIDILNLRCYNIKAYGGVFGFDRVLDV